jgi:hypothetical protein
MKCPSCHVPFSTAAPECPNCKLTLAQLDRKFGLVPYCSRYLSDRSERLHLEEIEKLRDLLRLFERKFPQICFSVLLIDAGAHISISEYAFWLINRARFSTIGAVGPKNFDLFFVVDPAGRAAALTTGYALEDYIAEQDLQDALATANDGFYAGDLSRGIRECTEFLMGRLREIALRIENKSPEHPAAVAATAADSL